MIICNTVIHFTGSFEKLVIIVPRMDSIKCQMLGRNVMTSSLQVVENINTSSGFLGDDFEVLG